MLRPDIICQHGITSKFTNFKNISSANQHVKTTLFNTEKEKEH